MAGNLQPGDRVVYRVDLNTVRKGTVKTHPEAQYSFDNTPGLLCVLVRWDDDGDTQSMPIRKLRKEGK
jgi:hypothetical protein